MDLRRAINAEHFGVGEEFITDMLRGKLRSKLESESAKNSVAQAFLQDLRGAFPGGRYEREFSGISEGLVATVNFHHKGAEGKTGAISALFSPAQMFATWE